MASMLPLKIPCTLSDSMAYSEQDGTCLQLAGNRGEIEYLYNLIGRIMIQIIPWCRYCIICMDSGT